MVAHGKIKILITSIEVSFSTKHMSLGQHKTETTCHVLLLAKSIIGSEFSLNGSSVPSRSAPC